MPLFSLWFLRRKAALNTSPTHLCHAVRLKRLQAYYISVKNDSVSERIYMYITYQGCEIGIWLSMQNIIQYCTHLTLIYNVLENMINVVIAQIDLRNIIYQIMNNDSATKV